MVIATICTYQEQSLVRLSWHRTNQKPCGNSAQSDWSLFSATCILNLGIFFSIDWPKPSELQMWGWTLGFGALNILFVAIKWERLTDFHVLLKILHGKRRIPVPATRHLQGLL